MEKYLDKPIVNYRIGIMFFRAWMLSAFLFAICSADCWDIKEENSWAYLPCEQWLGNADPTARVFNGRLYVYTSWDYPIECGNDWMDWSKPKQGYQQFCMPGYRLYSTSDSNLQTNWTAHGAILKEEDVPWVFPGDEGYKAAARMWAPDCVRGNDGRYYLFFPAPYKSAWDMKIGVAVADNPEGPYIPRDRPISGTTGIDPSVIKLPNGAWWIFTSNHGEIKGQKINAQFTKAEPGSELSGLVDGYKEGPHALIRAKRLTLFYAASIPNTGYTIQQAFSTNKNRPDKGFENVGTAITAFDGRTNHGSDIFFKGRHWAFYHRHREPADARWAWRRVVFSPVTFTSSGEQNTIKPYYAKDNFFVNLND